MILLHYTGMQSAQEAFDRLSDPASKVSAHYLVDEDGSVRSIVDEDKRAWHAGIAYWDGEVDINSYSIGVEIVNPGHEFGYRPFPEVQMHAVLKLCREIMGRHKIKHVLGHSDVAPERKTDPGELFDWKWLADHGVGLWPDVWVGDLPHVEAIARNDYEAEKLFSKFGYNPMAAYEDVVIAFHRHYLPERFKDGQEGKICKMTIARLLSLVHQVQERSPLS